MKVRVNFLNGTYKQYEGALITYMTDEDGTIIVCVEAPEESGRFLVSTIASIGFSTEKPQLAVTSVLIFGKK